MWGSGQQALYQQKSRWNIHDWATLKSIKPQNCGTSIRLEGIRPDCFDKLKNVVSKFKFVSVILRFCFEDAQQTLGICQAILINKNLKEIHLDLQGNAHDDTCISTLVDLVRKKVVISLECPTNMNEENAERLLDGILRNDAKLKVLNLNGAVLNERSVAHIQKNLEVGNISKRLDLSKCFGVFGASLTTGDKKDIEQAAIVGKRKLSNKVKIDWFECVQELKISPSLSGGYQFTPIPGIQVFDHSTGRIQTLLRHLVRESVDHAWQLFKRKTPFNDSNDNMTVDTKHLRIDEQLTDIIQRFEQNLGKKSNKNKKKEKFKANKKNKGGRLKSFFSSFNPFEKQKYQEEPAAKLKAQPLPCRYKEHTTQMICGDEDGAGQSMTISRGFNFSDHNLGGHEIVDEIEASFFSFSGTPAPSGTTENTKTNMSYPRLQQYGRESQQEFGNLVLDPPVVGASSHFNSSFVNIQQGQHRAAGLNAFYPGFNFKQLPGNSGPFDASCVDIQQSRRGLEQPNNTSPIDLTQADHQGFDFNNQQPHWPATPAIHVQGQPTNIKQNYHQELDSNNQQLLCPSTPASQFQGQLADASSFNSSFVDMHRGQPGPAGPNTAHHGANFQILPGNSGSFNASCVDIEQSRQGLAQQNVRGPAGMIGQTQTMPQSVARGNSQAHSPPSTSSPQYRGEPPAFHPDASRQYPTGQTHAETKGGVCYNLRPQYPPQTNIPAQVLQRGQFAEDSYANSRQSQQSSRQTRIPVQPDLTSADQQYSGQNPVLARNRDGGTRFSRHQKNPDLQNSGQNPMPGRNRDAGTGSSSNQQNVQDLQHYGQNPMLAPNRDPGTGPSSNQQNASDVQRTT
ncbi:uncharacterized protein LOC144432067 isoform X2 [Styela clava]